MIFSDYLIFADESGDHGLATIDPQFPVFALVFCMVAKDDYLYRIIPVIQKLKLDFWGHDQIILHEHDIRKEKGPFAILRTNREMRESFYHRLNVIIEEVPFEIVAAVIDKDRLLSRYSEPFNPYELSMLFCMERMLAKLIQLEQSGKTAHILVESRGAKEDRELELEFRRICDNRARWGYKSADFSKIRFELIFVDKRSNSSGLQLADLVARPIALNCLRPEQPNRAFDIIKGKSLQLKKFPEKQKGLGTSPKPICRPGKAQSFSFTSTRHSDMNQEIFPKAYRRIVLRECSTRGTNGPIAADQPCDL